MPAGNEPGARPESEARLLSLTAEIERLRSLGPDDQIRAALGLKLDEAAQLIERIGLLDDGVSCWTAFISNGVR